MWKRLKTWGTRYQIYIDIKLDRFFALGHWAKTLGLRAMVFSQGPPTGILSVVFLLGSNSAASACPSWLVNGILQHRNLLNNTDAMQCDAISAASLQAPCKLCPGLTMTPDTKPESLLVAWRCCKRWEQNLNTAWFLLARILHLLQKLKEIWI